jgi:hypothetical protein
MNGWQYFRGNFAILDMITLAAGRKKELAGHGG